MLEVDVRLPAQFLRPETYLVTLATFVNNLFHIDLIFDCFSFVVRDGGSKFAANEGLDFGCVFAPCEWTLKYERHPAKQSEAGP
jgi:hypothetical protein